MIIGTVTTDCSGVIACGINQIASTCLTNGVSGLNRTSGLGKSTAMFGNGVDGCVTICTCTTLNETKYYNNLTVNAGVVLDICS
jgi:hypothetical protein